MKQGFIGFFIGIVLALSISAFALHSGYFADGWKERDWIDFIHDVIENCEVDERGKIDCL